MILANCNKFNCEEKIDLLVKGSPFASNSIYSCRKQTWGTFKARLHLQFTQQRQRSFSVSGSVIRLDGKGKGKG